MTNSTNIKELRRAANLSQTELANRMNLSRAAITKWESGQSNPSKKNLERLSQILKAPLTPQSKPALEFATKNETLRNRDITLTNKLPILNYVQGKPVDIDEVNNNPSGYIQEPSTVLNYNDLYAIYITGNLLAPLHKNGEVRVVSPHKPFNSGDAVLLVVKDAIHKQDICHIYIYEKTDMIDNKEILTFATPTKSSAFSHYANDIIKIHKLLDYNELLGM